MKIALLGTQPNSIKLAPFKDLSWQIWACSPGNQHIPRSEVWFDLHCYDDHLRNGEEEWFAWLAKHPQVYMQRTWDDVPNSVEYPFDEMKQKWGPFFWGSSLSYMLAMAIESKPETIGLWGVDMSAASEYEYQRSGCHYFIQRAREIGIDIVVPPESDLLEPPPAYGYCMRNRMWRKLDARRKELRGRYDALRSSRQAGAMEETLLTGALDDLEYMIKTFPNT